MRIFITLDYELYFGEKTGSAAKCIIEPTERLRKIADHYNIPLSFFVDCGYILKLDEFRKKYPVLDNDYKQIIAQLELLIKSGHDLQLHIHPHWEDSFFDGNQWKINTSRYKLSDFN